MAAGELAYAIAMVDGELQENEQKKFHELVTQTLKGPKDEFDISDIIFKIMKKDRASAQSAYEYAIDEIKLNSHYLSPRMKNIFVTMMERVARAYLPVTAEEQQLIHQFRDEIGKIKGDPALYGDDL